MDILSYVLGYNKGKASKSNMIEEDLFPTETIEFEVHPTLAPVYYGYLGNLFSLTAGETYYVVWDGTTFPCVAQEATLSATGETGIAIGNLALGNAGEDTGEPFVIAYDSNSGNVIAFTLSTDSERDVRIYQKVSSNNENTFTFNVVEVAPLTTLTFEYSTLYKAYKCLMDCNVIGGGQQAIVVWDGKPYCDFSRNQIVPMMDSSGVIKFNVTMSNVLGNTAIATECFASESSQAGAQYVTTPHPYYMGSANYNTQYEIVIPYNENLGTSATPTHTVQIFKVVQ